jgi:hypothetical protein
VVRHRQGPGPSLDRLVSARPAVEERGAVHSPLPAHTVLPAGHRERDGLLRTRRGAGAGPCAGAGGVGSVEAVHAGRFTRQHQHHSDEQQQKRV